MKKLLRYKIVFLLIFCFVIFLIWALYPIRNDCSYPGENCKIRFEIRENSLIPYQYIPYEAQPNFTYQLERILKKDFGINYKSGDREFPKPSAPFSELSTNTLIDNSRLF